MLARNHFTLPNCLFVLIELNISHHHEEGESFILFLELFVCFFGDVNGKMRVKVKRQGREKLEEMVEWGRTEKERNT